jgi:phosphoribosyl-ATP pyrophosphohydrolase
MYHLSVLMEEMGITWDEVFGELARRELKESNLKVFNTKGGI